MKIFDLHARPGRYISALLAAIPFALLLFGYSVWSDARLAYNPADKFAPSLVDMAEAMYRMAFTPDRRTGDYLLWTDTLASLIRLGSGVGLGALVGFVMGIHTSLFPYIRASSRSFIVFCSIIPPLTLLPILFIFLGAGETTKISLIFIGTVFVIMRDTQLSVEKIPGQQITKSLTLGATPLSLAWRLAMPQVLPRTLDATRLALGAGWLFLIASEMISAQEGLGYRINLVKRYMAMDVIIPYVLWITLIGYMMDFGLRRTVAIAFPWYGDKR